VKKLLIVTAALIATTAAASAQTTGQPRISDELLKDYGSTYKSPGSKTRPQELPNPPSLVDSPMKRPWESGRDGNGYYYGRITKPR
jgi:hypothetical protein